MSPSEIPAWLKPGANEAPASAQLYGVITQTRNHLPNERLVEPAIAPLARRTFDDKFLQGPATIVTMVGVHPFTKTEFATNNPELAARLNAAAAGDSNAMGFARAVAALTFHKALTFSTAKELDAKVEATLAEDRTLPQKLLERFEYAERALVGLFRGETTPGFGTVTEPKLPAILASQAQALDGFSVKGDSLGAERDAAKNLKETFAQALQTAWLVDEWGQRIFNIQASRLKKFAPRPEPELTPANVGVRL